ncbi:MAG: DinB family protein [Candidatus Angelobacter sp.]
MPDQHLLDALLDSWDRNNTILVNLLRAIPPERLATRAMEGSPSVAELFTHIHYVRLVFVQEDAPEFLKEAVPEKEWHMIWHEGYHHGQIKLALKLAGHPIPNEQAGPVTWQVWMNTRKAPRAQG